MDVIQMFFGSPVITGRGRLARDLYLLGLLGEVMCLTLLRPILTVSAVTAHLGFPAAFCSILVLWTTGMLLVRRGHDFGVPGWATVVAICIWWAATFINPVNTYAHPQAALTGALGVLSVLPFLVYGVVPGDLLSNEYGEGRRPARPTMEDPEDDDLLTLPPAAAAEPPAS